MSKKSDDQFIRAAVEDSFSLKAYASETSNVQVSFVRTLVVAVVGALLGMILSIVVNSVLFEISINRLFSFYFGLIFCVVGSLIILRAWTQSSWLKRIGVLTLAIIVILAGTLSFLFRTEWLWWGSFSKVLIYTILGIATSFTVTFSWVDIVTFIHDLAKRRENGPVHKWGLIESPVQIWLVLLIAVITGVTYGIIFGVVQLEEMTEKHHSRDRLMRSLGKTELFSLPFGLVLGALGALGNEYLRHRQMMQALKTEIEYKPLNSSDIDGI